MFSKKSFGLSLSKRPQPLVSPVPTGFIARGMIPGFLPVAGAMLSTGVNLRPARVRFTLLAHKLAVKIQMLSLRAMPLKRQSSHPSLLKIQPLSSLLMLSQPLRRFFTRLKRISTSLKPRLMAIMRILRDSLQNPIISLLVLLPPLITLPPLVISIYILVLLTLLASMLTSYRDSSLSGLTPV